MSHRSQDPELHVDHGDSQSTTRIDHIDHIDHPVDDHAGEHAELDAAEHVDDDQDAGAPLADLPATPVHGYWKSLRELDGTAPFQVARTGHEFPSGSDQPNKDPLSRRNF